VVGAAVEVTAGWNVQTVRAALPRDARVFQILFLACLLSMGVLARDFTLRWEQMALTFASGLATQAIALRVLQIPKRGYLSAVVTCFGLSILLRADTLWVHPLAAFIAIGSKFVLRMNGKHVYNPANLGVMASLLLLPGTWISPGQWGHDLAAAAWFVMLGGVVSGKARRWDVSWMFLACFLGLVLARVLLLGQNPWVFVHQLGNGALLLFAFFMISDPMTIPNHRGARLVYALVVATVAIWWQYGLFRPNALVWALFLCTPLVPVFDRVWHAKKFQWRAAPA
jgi:Na+-transporting NADH:ubiquinone oxidoreductase subunit NqrB